MSGRWIVYCVYICHNFPTQDFGEKAKKSGKPVEVAGGAPANAYEEFMTWMQAGIPAYSMMEQAASALANIYWAYRLSIFSVYPYSRCVSKWQAAIFRISKQ